MNYNSCIYYGYVIHKRFQPFIHFFKYKVFSILFDYNEINLIQKNFKFFSYNKFNLISFYDIDHGYRNGKNLKQFVITELKKNKINIKNELKIKILCFPRIFGYVFNPLSIIYCYDKNGLFTIFYEVKNTSKEQHSYIFMNLKNNNNSIYEHTCRKKFYVSPFMRIEGFYNFQINDPKNNLIVNINQFLDDNSKILYASQNGKKIKLNSFNLYKSLIKYPFLTFKIILSIYWQAIKLWFKGAKFYSRVPKINDSKSYEK